MHVWGWFSIVDRGPVHVILILLQNIFLVSIYLFSNSVSDGAAKKSILNMQRSKSIKFANECKADDWILLFNTGLKTQNFQRIYEPIGTIVFWHPEILQFW